MRFMLMIYGNPKNWSHPIFLEADAELSESDRTSMSEQLDALFRDTRASGELLDVFALAPPRQAKLVSAKSGTEVTTDGPFAEAKEFLAGTFIFECESEERAIEIAKRFPDTRFGTVEVRPIMEL